MKNINYSESDIYFLKFIYKIGSYLGVYPLETSPLKRITYLTFYCIFNLIAVTSLVLEVKRMMGVFKLPPIEIIIFAGDFLALFCIHFACFHGMLKNKESWGVFLDIMNKLNEEYQITKNVLWYMFKLVFFCTLIIFGAMFDYWYSNNEMTSYSLLAYSFYAIIFLEMFCVTTILWQTANILVARYSRLTYKVEKVFSNKIVKIFNFDMNILNIRKDLLLLNQAVVLINIFMGKVFFILVITTFLNLLAVFNFLVFCYQSGVFFTLFKSSIGNTLLSLQLVVSTYFFILL